MKKRWAVILAAVMLLLTGVFAGCKEKEREPETDVLQICVDLGYIFHGVNEPDFQRSFRSNTLITNMLQAGKAAGVDVPREFEIEYIPAEGTERETVLQRIRTEIMSGGGPDLFIAACNTKYASDENEALFTMPEKAMELAIFMPLDEYMENETYFAEWDRMNQTVLAAGRNEEGQQIIPMGYTLPVAVYRAADVQHTPSKETTWMDMLESEDIALRAAAVWTDNFGGNYAEGMPFMIYRTAMTEFTLGALVDYKEEELLFTAEELEQRMSEILELGEQYKAEEFADAPTHYVSFLGREFDVSVMMTDMDGKQYDMMNGIERTENYTLIPLYSDDGGVTAEITVYAAINRNAEHPEEAWRVLDYLMSFNEQMVQSQSGSLYMTLFNGGGFGPVVTIPMYNELMCAEHRTLSVRGEKTDWCLSDYNFEQYCAVREQITHVRFRNALDKEFEKLYLEYFQTVESGGDGTAVAAEGYRQIQRLVRE